MYLSRIHISHFRNFSELDVSLRGNVVVVGENHVGKSNLLYALRLIFDPTVPDSSRQLGLSDFWDGLGDIDKDDKITVFVEVKDFEEDLDVLAILTDFRLKDDPETVRLTYEFRPQADLDGDPSSEQDYEFICYGGEDEAKEFGHDLRRRICMDLLPALRDAEGDLGSWRRSPLRPLIEAAFAGVDEEGLQQVATAVESATEKLTEFEAVEDLEKSIGDLFAEMSGPSQDVKPRFGFAPTDATRLYRNIRLLIDEGARGINDASLGSANLIFLTLKALELKRMLEENKRDHTILAIEEPEAHLHPHLQRSVYRHMFTNVSGDEPLSVFLTTHSPHIASVAPLRSILLLKATQSDGTVGHSTASISLEDDEVDDLTRYLDVTRAEMLFARGVILVEGDAERFLVPEFARMAEISLDKAGISVCSVSGTNFHPYAQLLIGLDIPFAIITDWDPRGDDKTPLGYNRTLGLVRTIEETRTGKAPEKVIKELEALQDYNKFCERGEEFGIFSNYNTLEVDLFQNGYAEPIIETLREARLGKERRGWVDEWAADSKKLDTAKYLSIIEFIGKGRFAQRLATRISDLKVPAYIQSALRFVTDRV
jgi:putative ATP-dependent endonuclease of the OLD family